MHTHAIPCPCRGGERKNVQMCEKKGTLAFGKKGSIIESFLATSLPLKPSPRSYVPARKRFRTIVRKVRGCFGFSLFHRLFSSLPSRIDIVLSDALWLNQESARANVGVEGCDRVDCTRYVERIDESFSDVRICCECVSMRCLDVHSDESCYRDLLLLLLSRLENLE